MTASSLECLQRRQVIIATAGTWKMGKKKKATVWQQKLKQSVPRNTFQPEIEECRSGALESLNDVLHGPVRHDGMSIERPRPLIPVVGIGAGGSCS